MVRVKDSVIINRPVDEVFAYATDIDRFPEWAASVQEAQKTSSGPTGVGTTLRTVSQFLGRRFTSDQEVTEYEPDRQMVSKATTGPIPFTITSTFEPVDGETRVTWAIEGETKGFFSVADPLLAQMFKRQVRAQLGTLKDLLEVRAAETT